MHFSSAICFFSKVLFRLGGHCDNPSIHSPKGFFVCDADGLSDDHKTLNIYAYSLIGASIAIQIVNIIMIDYDVIERIQKIIKDTTERKLVTTSGDGVTVNIALILDLLGVPKRLLNKALPGKMQDLILRHNSLPLHYHVHWAHTGLFRLLSLDPIFGMFFSVQDFLSYADIRGSIRILFNIWGIVAIFFSLEIFQPMHRAWCCYGAGKSIQDEHIDGTHYTCFQWIEFYYKHGDERIKDVFTDSDLFPNGSCMQHKSIGLAAAWSFATGVMMLVASLSLWVFAFVNAGDACERVVYKLWRRTEPKQRLLLIEVCEYLGIRHGKIKYK